MKNFVEVFLKDTSEKIQPLLKKNLFENMEQLVKENSTMFWNETKGNPATIYITKQKYSLHPKL